MDEAQLSNSELKFFINLMGLIDLMTYNYITELISSYKEKKDQSYLDTVQNLINELKIIKIKILDPEIFPEALNELNKVRQDHPELNETHEEFIKDVKNDIKYQNLNKKNSSRKSK